MASPKATATLTVWQRTYLIPDNEQPTEIRLTGSHRVSNLPVITYPIEIGNKWKRLQKLSGDYLLCLEYPRPISPVILSPQEEAAVDAASIEIRLGGKGQDPPQLQLLVGDILSLTPIKGLYVWARCNCAPKQKGLVNLSLFPG